MNNAEVPQSVAIIASLALGFCLGGLLVWWASLNAWREPLQALVRRLQAHVQHIQQENRALGRLLRQTSQAYTRELHQHQTTLREKSAVALDLARLEGRTRELALRLEESHGRLATAQRALEESQDKMSELQISLAGAKQRHEQNAQTVNHLQVERQALQTEVTILRQTLTAAQEELGRLHQLTAEKLAIEAQMTSLRQQLHQRESQHEQAVQQAAVLNQQALSWQAQATAAQEALHRQPQLQTNLHQATMRIQELEQALAQTKQDNLQTIDGIGPAFAKRLHATGIDSFAKLAQTPPAELRRIVQLKEWQAADVEGWIAQAQANLAP